MIKTEIVKSKAIGIFDSGLGGLTVVRAISRLLPNENIVFLGDIARVPYGSRSSETVRRYALNCAKHLNKLQIKLLVVACNTVSAVALDTLSNEFEIPVIGVIEPGARAGVRIKPSADIGVIATRRTIASGAYETAVMNADPFARVKMNPAPLLVPLAEEGWIDGDIVSKIVKHYLEPLTEGNIDALILGCTHYPLFKDVIREQLNNICQRKIPVVDSALSTAVELERELKKKNIKNSPNEQGKMRILVTDLPDKFIEIASSFLGESICSGIVEQIDIC